MLAARDRQLGPLPPGRRIESKPGREQRERVGVERLTGRVQARHRVVDPRIKALRGDSRRAAVGTVGAQAARLVVFLLRGDCGGLQSHDAIEHLIREPLGAFGVREMRRLRLRPEVGLAAVPHDQAEESQIRRRQRPAVDRQHLWCRARVGIVDVDDLEFGVSRNRTRQADQPFREKEAVGGAPRVLRRHIHVGAIRPVDGAEQGVADAAVDVEVLLDVRRRRAPCVFRFVTVDAGTTVRSQGLKKRVRHIEPARRQHRAQRARRIREIHRLVPPVVCAETVRGDDHRSRSNAAGRRTRS